MADNSKLSSQTLPIDKVKEMKERDFVQLLHEFWDYSLFHGEICCLFHFERVDSVFLLLVICVKIYLI